MKKHKGIAWYPVFNEYNEIKWKANPCYQFSEFVCKSPSDYANLGISKGKSIYCTFEENPETFLFVPSPQVKEECLINFVT